jgi:hypothetical protein
VELEFRLPGTAADLKLFVENKNYRSVLLVLPEPLHKIDLKTKLLPSSHTCGKPMLAAYSTCFRHVKLTFH